jgi:hypothetical protein
MDPVSLIVMLMILALFAGAMYVGYQKFVVEGDLFDTQVPMEPSEPSVTPPSSDVPPGGVPGVDNMRGRPKASVAPQGVKWYGTTEKLVPDGEAKTADVCKEYSNSLGINNWGWDRQSKSCFAYIDSSFLSAMADPTNVDDKSKYIVGCTNPGVKVYEGCRDMASGNVVWGDKYWWREGEDNGIDFWNRGDPPMSLEACRSLANDEGYDSFIYRTNRHPHLGKYGHTQCVMIKRPEELLTGWNGNLNDKSAMVMCVDPSKKVKDGCQ